MDLTAISELISPVLSHQITQFTVAFGVAAWIHSGRVKKEIASQMSGITGAIDRMSDSLKDELQELRTRVETLEKEK